METSRVVDILRATRALIHRENLKSNLRLIRAAIPADTILCAAVKAEGYGHGAVEIARILREQGVEVLGVSNPFEGAKIRNSGDTGRILLFGPSMPNEAVITVEAGLETMAGDNSYLDSLENAAVVVKARTPTPIHLKVDTGMRRIGCHPDEALKMAQRINASQFLELAGLATHFPSADSDLDVDLTFTRRQTELLLAVAENLKSSGIDPKCVHAANSGALAFSPSASLNMVRAGLALYGYGASPQPELKLKPVMEVRTRITAIRRIAAGDTVSYGRTWKAEKDAWIATLPIGYADGYQRILSNRSEVLINGHRYPQIGRICMDQMMVNLGAETELKLYDEAVIFGPDPLGPDAAELAELAGTIPYEITCGISERVPRVLVE